jgi:hypothetical protein
MKAGMAAGYTNPRALCERMRVIGITNRWRSRASPPEGFCAAVLREPERFPARPTRAMPENAMNPAIAALSRSSNADPVAIEWRLERLERVSALEKRLAELERKNARTQEIVTDFLALLGAPAALMAFTPQSWTGWIVWLYVLAVLYELMKHLFRWLIS